MTDHGQPDGGLSQSSELQRTAREVINWQMVLFVGYALLLLTVSSRSLSGLYLLIWSSLTLIIGTGIGVFTRD